MLGIDRKILRGKVKKIKENIMDGVSKVGGVCSNCKHIIGCFTFCDYRDISRPGWNCFVPDVNELPLTIDSQIHPNRISGNGSNIIVGNKKDTN